MSSKPGQFGMHRETSLKKPKPKPSQNFTRLPNLKDQDPEQGLVPNRYRGVFDE